MAEKRVWLFKEGNADMRNLLGGKGANLAEMTNLGLPVPPGLTITTETCMQYINNGNKMPEGLMDEVKNALHTVEEQAGKKFGDKVNPLLVSVRSGARVSMPGMMETILNLGLNDETVEAMIKLTNSVLLLGKWTDKNTSNQKLKKLKLEKVLNLIQKFLQKVGNH